MSPRDNFLQMLAFVIVLLSQVETISDVYHKDKLTAQSSILSNFNHFRFQSNNCDVMTQNYFSVLQGMSQVKFQDFIYSFHPNELKNRVSDYLDFFIDLEIKRVSDVLELKKQNVLKELTNQEFQIKIK